MQPDGHYRQDVGRLLANPQPGEKRRGHQHQPPTSYAASSEDKAKTSEALCHHLAQIGHIPLLGIKNRHQMSSFPSETTPGTQKVVEHALSRFCSSQAANHSPLGACVLKGSNSKTCTVGFIDPNVTPTTAAPQMLPDSIFIPPELENSPLGATARRNPGGTENSRGLERNIE